MPRPSGLNEQDYEFEELPLLSEGALFGGLVSGRATIAYHFDGESGPEWFVHEIYLDAYRKLANGQHERSVLVVDRDMEPQLYNKIWGELTDGSFKQHVQNKVEEWVREEMAYA